MVSCFFSPCVCVSNGSPCLCSLIFIISSVCARVLAQRHGRAQETQLKCTKARNDYLLNLAAANAAMNKYYLQDVSTLIDVRNNTPRPSVCLWGVRIGNFLVFRDGWRPMAVKICPVKSIERNKNKTKHKT